MRWAAVRWAAVPLAAVLWAAVMVAGAMAQPNTPPPQNPATQPPGMPTGGTGPARPAVPATMAPLLVAPSVLAPATLASGVAQTNGRSTVLMRGQLTLSEFLNITLGQVARRAYVLMPNAAMPNQLITADLDRFAAGDPMPLVRQVLATLGLGVTEVSGVLLIHPQTGREISLQGQTLWVYSPRHRTVASLAAYFGLFPKLAFAYTNVRGGAMGSLATMDTYGNTLNAAGVGAWPVGAGMESGGMGGTGLGVGAGGAGAAMGWGGAEAGAGGVQVSPWSAGGWPGAAWVYPAGGFAAVQGSYNTSGFHESTAASDPPALLVVRGQTPDIEALKRFLELVDIPVPEVLLQAYVLEVRDAENRDSAVQLVLDLLGGRVTGQLGAAPAETNLLRLAGREGGIAIGRLTSDSRVRLVSSPRLRASDGSVASVTIGTDTPTLGSIVTFSGSSQQSVTYQSAGVLLNISPRILGESIRLLIWQEVSSFIRTETGLSATPTKLRRAFRSDVIARSGETILLGGLSEFSQSRVDNTTFLGLGSRSRLRSNSEVVVLLQVQRLEAQADSP